MSLDEVTVEIQKNKQRLADSSDKKSDILQLYPWSAAPLLKDNGTPEIRMYPITTSSRSMGYADDTTVYVKSKNPEHLKIELGNIANIMVNFCNTNGLT